MKTETMMAILPSQEKQPDDEANTQRRTRPRELQKMEPELLDEADRSVSSRVFSEL